MDKPRIFIYMHYLELGGTESALIGLLHNMNPQWVDVDLFLGDHRGMMMKYIPKWVNVLPPVIEYTLIERPIFEVVKKGYFKIALKRLLAKFRYKLYSLKNKPTDSNAIYSYVAKYLTPVLPSLKNKGLYDLAISYLSPHKIVLDKVSAKKKICWIHTDYSVIDIIPRLEYKMWEGYDKIISISPAVTQGFLGVFPSLSSKIIEIDNPLPERIIKENSTEFIPSDMPHDAGVINLLTIGRYSDVKRLDSIPYLCRRLVENGLNVKWYIIGYGSDDNYIKEKISQEGMYDNVFILGRRDNPYPYIKACDWYVQPSKVEGKSITVREAQLLGKPVIVTNYPTAKSQINDGIDGVIVPLEINECWKVILEVLKDKNLKNVLANNLKFTKNIYLCEMRKIYSIIGIECYLDVNEP